MGHTQLNRDEPMLNLHPVCPDTFRALVHIMDWEQDRDKMFDLVSKRMAALRWMKSNGVVPVSKRG